MIFRIVKGNINIQNIKKIINNKYTQIGYGLILVFKLNLFKG